MGFEIPDNAVCEWSGELFKIYTRQQKLFDGNYKRFETVVKEDAVHSIIIQGDQIVICRQKQPHKKDWYEGLIAGRLPRGKDPLAHMKEELREETGMVSDDITLWKTYIRNGSIKKKTYYYVIKNPQVVGDQMLDPGGEMLDVVTVSFDEFVKKILHEGLDTIWLKAEIQSMIINGTLEDFRKYLFDE